MDVMVQDWQYWGKYGWNAMQWDETHYPDPAGLVRGTAPTPREVDGFGVVEDRTEIVVGKEFADRDLFLPGTQWVDFFNPEARRCTGRISPAACCLSGSTPGGRMPPNRRTTLSPARRPSPVPETVSGWSIRCSSPRPSMRDSAKTRPSERVFILTRSAFAGEQRYAAATWSGDIGNDWETLRRQVAAGLNLSATGLPYWTTDTGGFFRPGDGQYTDIAYHERFLRWLQFSTFTPLMRVHGFQTKTEPWHFGAAVEAQARQYLEMRYRLLPYIYSQAAEITFRGSTLMRPLVMDFRDDERRWHRSTSSCSAPRCWSRRCYSPGAEWPVYAPRSGRLVRLVDGKQGRRRKDHGFGCTAFEGSVAGESGQYRSMGPGRTVCGRGPERRTESASTPGMTPNSLCTRTKE